MLNWVWNIVKCWLVCVINLLRDGAVPYVTGSGYWVSCIALARVKVKVERPGKFLQGHRPWFVFQGLGSGSMEQAYGLHRVFDRALWHVYGAWAEDALLAITSQPLRRYSACPPRFNMLFLFPNNYEEGVCFWTKEEVLLHGNWYIRYRLNLFTRS